MQSGFRLLKSEVRDLTLSLATEFNQLAPSPTEREINKSRIKHLREKADAGQLITFMWAKARLDGKWVRVNGQHSSQMLVELNGGFPEGLKVHLDEYEVEGLDGLAQLFRQFDDRKSGRSASDVSGAYQNIVPELHGVARPIGKIAIDGIAWWRSKIEKEPGVPKGDNQYTLFHEIALHDFILWANDVFSIKTPEMRNIPVVAAMYATFNAHPDQAKKFWESVARGGDEYDESAPATVLDEWLKGLKEDRDNKIRPVHIYQGCIYAYNAMRKGQSLKSIKYDFKTYQEPIVNAA